MKGLEGKVVVVAGGASGLGAATAKRLGAERARVLVGDLNMDGARRTVEEIVNAGGIAEAFACDISKDDDCRKLIDAAKDSFGGVQGLYNVAADLSPNNLGRDSDVVSVPLDVLDHTLDVNLKGYFYTSRHAIPAMLESGGGDIVHMSSGVVLGLPTFVSYGLSKSGIIALSRHIAVRWGKENIRSNVVDPGVTLTENQLMSVSEELRAQMLPAVNSSRFGEPEEIAATVAFLLSSESRWINGQTYAVSSMAGAP